MAVEHDLIQLANDLSQRPAARIEALRALDGNRSDDVLAAARAIAERTGEDDEVAYTAGWLLARVHSARGSLDNDVWWADFSDGGHHGFFDSAAALNGVDDPNRTFAGYKPRG